MKSSPNPWSYLVCFVGLCLAPALGCTAPEKTRSEPAEPRQTRAPLLKNVTEQQLISPAPKPNGAAGYGLRVAVSQGTVAIAEPGFTTEAPELRSGAVQVYARSGGNFELQQSLRVPKGDAGPTNFGLRVAIDGDTLVSSAQGETVDDAASVGAAYVFTRSGTDWVQRQRLIPSDPSENDSFGETVAIDQDRIAISSVYWDAVEAENAGAVYVFEEAAGSWTEDAKLTPEPPVAHADFGRSLDLSGDTLLIGAPQYPTTDTNFGAAFISTRNAEGQWSSLTKITPPEASFAGNFGYAVAIDGDTALIAAYSEPHPDESPTIGGVGAVYVYQRTGGVFELKQKLRAPTVFESALFGFSVGLSGDRALVGAMQEPNGEIAQAGAAHLFQLNSGTWEHEHSFRRDPPLTGDQLGFTVALDDGVAVMASYMTDISVDDTPLTDGGAAFVYQINLLDNGTECTADSDCTSAHCIDGVCCDTLCDGACQSCLATEKVSGTDGVCGPVRAGTDPDDDCSEENPASCGLDGSCDGAGACRKYVAGSVCGRPLCASLTEAQLPSTCDGQGTCQTNGTASCADGYACIGFSCRTTCTADADCIATHHCSNQTCSPDKPLGEACTRDSECQSQACVDGVCCNATCDGPCTACSSAKKGAGLDGFCEPIVAGTDPDQECTKAADACGADGQCDGQGECRSAAPLGTPCGETACTENVVTGRLCDGEGGCSELEATCHPFRCGPDACRTDCEQESDCNEAGFCAPAKVCVEKRALGSSCSSEDECETGFCVDGVCCDGACTGQCEACDSVTAPGRCTPVVGVPHGERPPCTDGGDAVCAGHCDGKTADRCLYPGVDVLCGDASCEGSTAHGNVCDGAGHCGDAMNVSCAPYVCGESRCLSSCQKDSDCSSGHVCQSGHCLPPPSAHCSGDSTLESADGSTQACAPFICRDGACLDACTSDSECSGGARCVEARCVAVSETSSVSAASTGCSCSLAPSSSRTPFGALGFLLLALAARRTRRDHYRPNGS